MARKSPQAREEQLPLLRLGAAGPRAPRRLGRRRIYRVVVYTEPPLRSVPMGFSAARSECCRYELLGYRALVEMLDG